MPSHQFETPSSPSRERLLRAARRLFAAQGYEQTATSAIARQAGTSESQLMRYFGGKVGLLDALLEEAWGELNARVDRVVLRTADPRRGMLDAMLALVSALGRDLELARLMLFEARRLRGSEPRIRSSRGYLAFSDTVRALVRRAQATHDLDPQLDTAAVTSALLGATESLARDRVVARAAGGRGLSEREIRRTLETMIAGFGGDSSRAAKRRA